MNRYSRLCIVASLGISAMLYSQTATAQEGFFFFAHGLYATPLDNYFKHNYNYGIGIEGGAALEIRSTFIVGTIGYSSFSAHPSNPYGEQAYIPIKVGLRHYVFPGRILFVHADAGLGIVSNKLTNGSRFSGDFGVGVRLGIFEVMADYDGFTRQGNESGGYSSWLGIKAGVRIGI